MGIEQARTVLIVICSVVSLALALNFFFFFKKPVSKGVAVLITVGLCVILVVIKSLLKQNNSDFGGLFAYPILFYFLLKKKEKQKESLNQIDSPAKEELEPTALTQIKTLSCISCGTENQTEALFCQKCGNSLSGVTAQLKPIVKLQETRPAIWNPNSTALWSLVLSPAFGSFLLMLNWRALGEPEKAVSARNWYFASLVMFTINVFIVAAGMNIDAGVLEIEMVDSETADLTAQLIWLLFTVVWYFSAVRAQSKYVKEMFGSSYAKKPWVKALLKGFGVLVGWFIGIGLIAAIVLG